MNAGGIKTAERGYSVVYRSDRVIHCPGCGRSQWLVGRSTAECAFCATALPITGNGQHEISGRGE